MKAILEFNLPEEAEEYKNASNGMNAHIAISEFYNESLRKRLKYQDLPARVQVEVEKIREEFSTIMKEYEIDF